MLGLYLDHLLLQLLLMTLAEKVTVVATPFRRKSQQLLPVAPFIHFWIFFFFYKKDASEIYLLFHTASIAVAVLTKGDCERRGCELWRPKWMQCFTDPRNLFYYGLLCLSLRGSVSPFRPSGSHLHYILDRQDIHAFLTHCPSPWGEGPERDVRTPGLVLCPSALFTHPAGNFLSGVTETCVV